jgi:hypothetical protein
LTRQRRLLAPTDRDEDILSVARELLRSVREDRPVRLVGVGVAALGDGAGPRQGELPLFPEEQRRREDQRRLDQALDDIRRRFGESSIRRGV